MHLMRSVGAAVPVWTWAMLVPQACGHLNAGNRAALSLKRQGLGLIFSQATGLGICGSTTLTDRDTVSFTGATMKFRCFNGSLFHTGECVCFSLFAIY